MFSDMRRVTRLPFGSSFLCRDNGRRAGCIPLRAGEEMNLPTEGNCAHANCFEEPFLFLYGAVSSESLFENRQTLALVLELWRCGVHKALLFTPLALCSGSGLSPRRQFGGQFLLMLLRWKTSATHLMGRVRDFSNLRDP